MKGKKDCYKKGGAAKNRAIEHDVEEEAEGHGPGKNGGGAVHKKGHKAEGHKAKARPDKRARGGRIMTPKSPLSGAEPKGLPGGGKGENRPDKSND